MPRRLVVRYLPAAEGDLLAIYRWIFKESASRAASFLSRVDKRIGRLSIHPRFGRVPRHPRLQEAGYRVIMIESYLVFYVIRGSVVEIHRVVHGSRSLDAIV